MDQIVKYNITDAAIAEMSASYLNLRIIDINDTDGFRAVHSARMIVKTKRIDVEKMRKDLKADALKYGRAVDAEAARITAQLEPIETYLETEENRIEAEKNAIKAEKVRIAAEAEAKARELVITRINTLAALGVTCTWDEAAEPSQEDFDEWVTEARTARAEADRIAKDQAEQAKAEREAEAKRIADERAKFEAEQAAARAENERIRLEQKSEADRIRLEQARIDEEKRASVAQETARARAEKEATEKIAAEKLHAETLRLENERAALLLPDREKLTAWAAAIRAVAMPIFATTEMREIATAAMGKIENVLKSVEK